jgi:dienelactone hydrolase
MEISVVAFDFSGSGNSDGQYVSLGYYEQDDLEAVVAYLRKNDQTTRIGLWGRSMGASTSLMFGVSDPSVACMVLDSPFSSLKILANELVTKNEVKIPKMVVTVAFKLLKKSIEKKALFDIDKLEPIKSAPSCFIPALFAHANSDDFIDPSHSKNISDKYAGDYNLITFEGNHISHRPMFFYDSVCIFFNNNLNINSDFGEENTWVEEEISQEELTKIQNPFRNTFQDDLARARQLSLQEAYVDDDEEALQLALKLSLLDSQQSTQTQNQTQPSEPSTAPSDPKPAETKLPRKDSKKIKKDKKEKDPNKKKK